MASNERDAEKRFSPRILIFDKKSDDSFLRAHYLRYCEFDVFEENTANHFFEKITDINPDLVIISELFSPVGGFELCAMFRKQARLNGIFIILLLEEDLEPSKIRAQLSGADEVVRRPKITDRDYSYHKITDFVHRHLIGKNSRK